MQGLIRFSIARPVGVIALMMMVFLFGLVALSSVPIQMTPDIEKPILQVRVSWPGAAPEDVDREIISRMESALSSLSGIEQMESRSFSGSARVTLTYSVNQDMDKALTLLLSKLSGITGLPDDSKRPVVRTSNSDDSPIARLALISLADTDQALALERLGRFLETGIKTPLARVPGVAEVFEYGGGDRELRVLLDPQKLRRYQLSIAEVIDALRSASLLASVGQLDEGKRSYTVRMEAIAYTPEAAGQIIVRPEQAADGTLRPVLLSDIAEIVLDVKKRTSFRRLNGEDAVIVNILREPGSNVVATMVRLRAAVDRLNQTSLKPRQLQLRIVYDETGYISSALSLVQQNIIVGGLLAFSILLLFLRSILPTLVIFVAIPVSVIGTFVAIAGQGLSINVISLAGLAFAVGMVVDASIVSLENIFRLRQGGMQARDAAYHGARQVWAPILGSALTTVIVFIPVITLDLPVGQLFRDIGIAISVSVLISVLVSVTVIPAIAARLLGGRNDRFSNPLGLPGLDHLARGFSRLVVGYAKLVTGRPGIGVSGVVIIVSAASWLGFTHMPKLDYLPDGNANFVFGRLIVPPGYSIDETRRIAERMELTARPLWQGETKPDGPPAIDRFFFVAYSGGAFAGASSQDPSRVRELNRVLMMPIFREPGARAFFRQASLFGRSVGGSRSIRINVSGPDIERIEPVVSQLNDRILAAFPVAEGNQLRVLPGLNSQVPQIRVEPDPAALARAGIGMRELAHAVAVFNDGITVTQIPLGGELIDLVVAGSAADQMTLETLASLPVITRQGVILRLDQLAEVAVVSAPLEIRRLGGRQVMQLQLRPDESIALEDAVTRIRDEIIPRVLDVSSSDGIAAEISGAASELKRSWQAMQTNVLAALVVIFLLLAVLLRSFVLPMIILLVVPVAASGGLGALILLNQYIRQPLDMLTMLGFVILSGVVVNNAILMVEQTALHIREEAMTVADAIIEATRNRIRPIFMSTLTSLFGLVPLVIFPGAGSELYRGIGTVVFGGLALSTLATLIMIPPMLAVFGRLLENRDKD